MNLRDTNAGCSLIAGKPQQQEIPICLNCPLRNCLYDPKNKMHISATTPAKATLQLRNQEIVQLATQGNTLSQLARRFNLSTAGAQHALKTAKRRSRPPPKRPPTNNPPKHKHIKQTVNNPFTSQGSQTTTNNNANERPNRDTPSCAEES
jgi:DNA-binding CsgD family transcriptional regulator